MILTFKSHSATSLATPPAAVSNSTGTAATGSSSTASGSSSSSSGSTSSSSSSSANSGTKTITGDSIDTRWGPVQVKITVTNGKITAADAVVYPLNNPRDQQINAYAVPTLNQEAVQAGNANIQMVSGATYTSEGYIQSLQSALNKA
jgi:uncharacterized protein with FMN-binding domain